MQQHTLSKKVSIQGTGIHSGNLCGVAIEPAPPDSGIVFYHNQTDTAIPVSINADINTERSTSISSNGATVRTIEHLLATFFAMGIDNAKVTVSGEELPILDGSAKEWVELLKDSPLIAQNKPCRIFSVPKQIKLEDEKYYLEASPSDKLEVIYMIDFPNTPIGQQEYHFIYSPERFIEEIAPARTCGFLEEVESLSRRNLGLGGSLENCVVVTSDRYLTSLRFTDEVVRHKILDFLGDIGLLGRKIVGRFVIRKGGHALHLKLIRELASQLEVIL